MDWRKFDLVEYKKGRYRLERQTWTFWDWCLALFAVALIARFWMWVIVVIASVGVVAMGVAGAGLLLAWWSRPR